jgi:hypothetical protein
LQQQPRDATEPSSACGADVERTGSSRGVIAAACPRAHLPPIEFDELLAHAICARLLSASVHAMLVHLVRIRRECSDPSAKKVAFCLNQELARWLDGVLVRAGALVKSEGQARCASAGDVAVNVADADAAGAAFRGCAEKAVFRVLQECGVWRDA